VGSLAAHEGEKGALQAVGPRGPRNARPDHVYPLEALPSIAIHVPALIELVEPLGPRKPSEEQSHRRVVRLAWRVVVVHVCQWARVMTSIISDPHLRKTCILVASIAWFIACPMLVLSSRVTSAV